MKEFSDYIQFEDKLNKYLKGQLDKAEEIEFVELLKGNPKLKEKAIATAQLAKALNQVGMDQDTEIISEIKETSLSELNKVIDSTIGDRAAASKVGQKRIIPFKRFIVSFSAAASILLCVFGGYKYYKYEQTISLGSEYLAYFPASEYSRGEESGINHKLIELYSSIEKKEHLDTTIKELSKMWDDSMSETYNDCTEYMPEIGWMLANAYLRDNDRHKALEVLNVLIKEYSAETAIGIKARELKDKIEKL